MKITEEDKIVIKNDFLEYGLNANQIWNNHKAENWDRVSVWRVVQNVKKTGSIKRKPGSGRPVTATTEENQAIVDELICSQEDDEGTHEPPRKIAETLQVSRSSVKRMIKASEINQFKRMSEPRRDEGALERRTRRANGLVERFEKNPRSIEKLVWQDEKDFPLEVPLNRQNNRVYYKGLKRDIPAKNLFFQTKKMCKKVMVSAALTWQGATKPFFVNKKGIKVNAVNYHKHLKRELFPAIENLIKRDDWIFIQDGASSHTSNLVQNFLKEELKRRYVNAQEWPPTSPDSNPLDYFFWNKVKEKVYEGRHNQPFRNEGELISRIKKVWSSCANDKEEIRRALRQFVPRLKAVVDNNGGSIKKKFA